MDQSVFREYATYAVSNIKDLNWDSHVSEPHQAARSPRRTRLRRKGSPSLVHMAVKVAADHIERFDLQYLESVRPELIMLLHEELGSTPG